MYRRHSSHLFSRIDNVQFLKAGVVTLGSGSCRWSWRKVRPVAANNPLSAVIRDPVY